MNQKCNSNQLVINYREDMLMNSDSQTQRWGEHFEEIGNAIADEADDKNEIEANSLGENILQISY